MEDLVSIIITTHKRTPDILKRAIDSVYAQTYRNFEIFVVDDAPEFNEHKDIVNLVKSYDSKLNYIINDRFPGACASRNDGIKASKGRFIALLDDDDEWLPNKLEIMIPKFTDNVGLVYANWNIVNINSNKKYIFNRKIYSENIVDNLFLVGNFIGGCSVPIMTRESIFSVGLFDENFKSAQDYDVWIRIAKKYSVVHVDETVVNYYISDVAISASPKRQVLSSKMMLDKYAEDYLRLPNAKRTMASSIIYYSVVMCDFKGARLAYNQYSDVITYGRYVKLFLKGVIKYFFLTTNLHNR